MAEGPKRRWVMAPAGSIVGQLRSVPRSARLLFALGLCLPSARLPQRHPV
jgi:hypothetical protein